MATPSPSDTERIAELERRLALLEQLVRKVLVDFRAADLSSAASVERLLGLSPRKAEREVVEP